MLLLLQQLSPVGRGRCRTLWQSLWQTGRRPARARAPRPRQNRCKFLSDEICHSSDRQTECSADCRRWGHGSDGTESNRPERYHNFENYPSDKNSRQVAERYFRITPAQEGMLQRAHSVGRELGLTTVTRRYLLCRRSFCALTVCLAAAALVLETLTTTQLCGCGAASLRVDGVNCKSAQNETGQPPIMQTSLTLQLHLVQLQVIKRLSSSSSHDQQGFGSCLLQSP